MAECLICSFWGGRFLILPGWYRPDVRRGCQAPSASAASSWPSHEVVSATPVSSAA